MTSTQKRGNKGERARKNDPHLRNIQVRLHDQERIERIRPRRIRVIKKVLDLRKRRLSEPRPAILRRDAVLSPCLVAPLPLPVPRVAPEPQPEPVGVLQTERLGRVRERGDDTRMERLHLLEACGEELALRG